ncbi:MAG: metallophosphoesterase, partial [Pseudomonadota bacterium]|nr:metallophosphoesterase [Pseudomonadota bacterium]
QEFIQAKAFLDRLPRPQVVVPGNHDIPLYNIVERMGAPLGKFRRYVESDLSPAFVDDEVMVLGVNTARSAVVKGGRVNIAQLRALSDRFCAADKAIVKVLVSHHPFDVGPEGDAGDIVGRANAAMRVMAECGVDVLLAGHLHTSRAASTGARYAVGGYEALVVSAGTATSTRGRGEANAFNVLQLCKEQVDVQRFEWNPPTRQFARGSCLKFERSSEGWRRS